ncbi:MAG: hypothetical protein K6A71_12405 [Lachnospiraceae bacterium]|nr:hypothetical protein [Lachnospiraceae bacterium]
MAVNKINDDELDLVNGGVDLTRSGGDKLFATKDMYCPQCRKTVPCKPASGDRLYCPKGHEIKEAELNSKLLSGGGTEMVC